MLFKHTAPFEIKQLTLIKYYFINHITISIYRKLNEIVTLLLIWDKLNKVVFWNDIRNGKPEKRRSILNFCRLFESYYGIATL